MTETRSKRGRGQECEKRDPSHVGAWRGERGVSMGVAPRQASTERPLEGRGQHRGAGP